MNHEQLRAGGGNNVTILKNLVVFITLLLLTFNFRSCVLFVCSSLIMADELQRTNIASIVGYQSHLSH